MNLWVTPLRIFKQQMGAIDPDERSLGMGIQSFELFRLFLDASTGWLWIFTSVTQCVQQTTKQFAGGHLTA
ncbi:hypothetical protein BK644_04095 [Pseudomonas protegens]|nr:hypothetical protein BK644_04095 [Pseudomonas protegens]